MIYLLLAAALDVYPCQITLPNTSPRSLMGIGGGCGDSAQPTASAEPTKPEVAGVDVVEFVQNGYKLSGYVKNNTSKTVRNVRVFYEVRLNGKLLETNWTPVQGRIDPGKTAQFEGVVDDIPGIVVKATKVSWTEID